MLASPSNGELKVIDGDTLILQGQRIRLDGIDAHKKNSSANVIKSFGTVDRKQQKHWKHY